MFDFLNILRKTKKHTLFTAKKWLLGTSKADLKLIVIGAQKGGTTALYHYLSEHPDIDVPHNKEVDYFNSLGNRDASLKDYQSLFPFRFNRNENFASIDVSPSYLLDAKFISHKIHSIAPNIKIVAVLREPVSRAVSAWFMYKKLVAQNPDWFIESPWVKNNSSIKVERRQSTFGENFDNDIAEEISTLESGNRIEFPIVEYGFYKEQLEYFINVFGRDNLLILSSVDLKKSTQNCLDKITSLIDLPTHSLEKEDLVPHFVGNNKHSIPNSSLKRLEQYYKQRNEGLSKIINNEFDWRDSKS